MQYAWEIMYAFAELFVFCEFGEQISIRFEDLNNEICKFDWYLLPIEMQQTMQIIIMTTQQPVQLVGFGNIVCCRQTFKRVTFFQTIYFIIY